MRDLLLGITAMRFIPNYRHHEADEVRRYRNAVVHEGDETASEIPLDQALERLCRYFSHLPYHW
jgi:hypothetical protein